VAIAPKAVHIDIRSNPDGYRIEVIGRSGK
jgi:hypothetical protein